MIDIICLDILSQCVLDEFVFRVVAVCDAVDACSNGKDGGESLSDQLIDMMVESVVQRFNFDAHDKLSTNSMRQICPMMTTSIVNAVR